MVVLGFYSVAGGFAQRANFGITYAESAGQANIAERDQRTASDITQRYGTVIFLGATGLLLTLIAVEIGQFFIPSQVVCIFSVTGRSRRLVSFNKLLRLGMGYT